ncbi:MAG: DUF3298 and DUF4163 domain-containing protein [Anaerolineales bacterium]
MKEILPLNRKIPFLFASLLALACNVTFTFGIPTPTLPPAPVNPTATAAPLSAQVTLVSVPFIETNLGGEFPPYTLTASTPQLLGSDDPRVKALNQRLSTLVQKEVDSWRQNFQQLPVTPLSNGSSLEATFTLPGQIGDLWSFKFDFSFYSDGAAHPGLYSLTLTYDLASGRELALSDLFLPTSNYLEAISAYCITELSKQPFFEGPFTEGAQPALENYRNWNITPQGLMITFDEYQVAPYAAGPQTVVVPFAELSGILAPGGPLAEFAK